MKFKKVLFYFVTIAMLVYTALATIYSVLPEQYQIQEFNKLTALVSGGSTGLIGSAGLLIKSWLSKSATTADEKQTETLQKFLVLLEKYEELIRKLESAEKLSIEQKADYDKQLAELTMLVKTDLKVKLSNKFVEKEVKDMIAGALNYEKNEAKDNL